MLGLVVTVLLGGVTGYALHRRNKEKKEIKNYLVAKYLESQIDRGFPDAGFPIRGFDLCGVASIMAKDGYNLYDYIKFKY